MVTTTAERGVFEDGYSGTDGIRGWTTIDPRRALVLVLEWANEHRAELMEDWNLCRAKQLPNPIKPLE